MGKRGRKANVKYFVNYAVSLVDGKYNYISMNFLDNPKDEEHPQEIPDAPRWIQVNNRTANHLHMYDN